MYIAGSPGLPYRKDAHFVPAELKERYPPTQRRILNALATARGILRLVELSHPVVAAGVCDTPAGSALVLGNFTYEPIDKLTMRMPSSSWNE